MRCGCPYMPPGSTFFQDAARSHASLAALQLVTEVPPPRGLMSQPPNPNQVAAKTNERSKKNIWWERTTRPTLGATRVNLLSAEAAFTDANEWSTRAQSSHLCFDRL